MFTARSTELSGFIGGKLKQKGTQGSASHESKHRSTPWAAEPESPRAASMFTDVSPLCSRPTRLSLLGHTGPSEWVLVPGEHRLSESSQHLFRSLFPHIPEDHHVRSRLPVYSTSLFRTGYSQSQTVSSPTEWDWTLWCLGCSLSLFSFQFTECPVPSALETEIRAFPVKARAGRPSKFCS